MFPVWIEEMLGATFEQRNMQEHVLLIAKVTKLCRQEMFIINILSFAGTFSRDCENQGVLQCLKLLASYAVVWQWNGYGSMLHPRSSYNRTADHIQQQENKTKYNSRTSGDE